MSLLEFLRDTECVLKLHDLRVHADADGLVWMVFDLKDRPVNVVNLDILGQAEQVMAKLDELINAGRCKVVLIASGKANTFIAGADIDALYPNVDPLEAEAAAGLGQKAFQRIHQLSVPTVAVINGAALGAGLEISLASTYRICADNSQIQLGLPEVKLGLLPGAGGTVRLAKLVGLQQALAMILSGASIRPKKALEIGLVDAVLPYQDRHVSENRFFAESRKFALKLIDKPSDRQLSGPLWRGSIRDRILDGTFFGRYLVAKKAAEKLDAMSGGRYPAPYLALDSVMYSFSCEEDAALRYEAILFGRLAATPESKSLMALFYMMENTKKTEQRLKARPLPIQKAGVIGAGVMGVQIAIVLARKGFKVYMRDIKTELIANGLSKVSSYFSDLVSRGRMTAPKAAASIALVEGGTKLDGFTDCQVVIESAVEQMNLKKRILTEVEKVLQPTAVFASNTSSLSIEELAASAQLPQRVLGMHFFNPVTKMPLVEVIKSSKTSPEAIATIYNLSLLLGKTPVICRDGPGFVVNRILGIYMNEAGNLAMEGNSIEDIDNALLAFGMPMGPFRLMDEVGLDVAAHVAPVLQQGLGDRFQQHPEFGAILNANAQMLGKKSKAGFFLYNDAGKVTGLNSVLTEALRRVQRSDLDQCSQQDIIDRCILLSLQEASRILEAGLVASAEELDIAMVLGTGFAPFRGGLLNYADQRGLGEIVQRLGAMKLQYGERFEPHPLLCRMAENGERFFPDRPVGMKSVDKLPRSKL